jgi:hypothetical protein
VVVDRPFGVLHVGGDPIHRQGLEALGDQNGLGHPKDFLGALLDFPLLSSDFDHSVNY